MIKPVTLDERDISWKILLPFGLESRICAIGLSEGELAGLSRSYEKVDTEPVEGLEYDAVIFSDKGDDNQYDIISLISQIKPTGIFVDAYGECATGQLKGTGLRYFRHYAALPPEKPRLFIPLTSKRIRSKALSFHVPGSLKAYIGLTLTRSLSSMGIKKHMTKRTISLYAHHEDILDKGGLIEWISSKLGYPILDLVIYAGSESPRRKITALAIASQQDKDIVVRIADTESGANAISQESQALRAIGISDISELVPKLIVESRWKSYYVQIQEGMSDSTQKQVAHLTKSHLKFLLKLSRINRNIKYFRETWIWGRLKAWAQTNSVTDMPYSVRNLLQTILSSELADKSVVCHRIHGDFTPWNIKVCGKRFFVYDWEDSLPDGLAFTDAFHFLYRQASLVGPWPGAVRMLHRMIGEVTALCQSEGLRSNDKGIYLKIWMLNEYMNNRSDRIVEMCDKLYSGIEDE